MFNSRSIQPSLPFPNRAVAGRPISSQARCSKITLCARENKVDSQPRSPQQTLVVDLRTLPERLSQLRLCYPLAAKSQFIIDATPQIRRRVRLFRDRILNGTTLCPNSFAQTYGESPSMPRR